MTKPANETFIQQLADALPAYPAEVLGAPLSKAQRFFPASEMHSARVVVIDNYDSFTFNLVQYLLELRAVVEVVRNDEVSAQQVFDAAPSHLLLSPGPGTPADSGVCQALSREVVARKTLPTLGVCLGHQTLCEVHGAKVSRAERIMHGKLSDMAHDERGLFEGLPTPFAATRYHSLIVEANSLPAQFVAVAQTEQGELMAVRHTSAPVFGLQFHPESILSEHGHAILANFLRATPAVDRADP